MARKRYFTVAEAEALIPRIEPIFVRLLQLHAHIRATGEKLAFLGHAPTQALIESTELSGPPGVRQLKARFRGLYESMSAEVAAIEAMGGQVQDLEQGLCDFPALLGGRDEVLLCWRVGEKRIGWWHDLASGFAGRRPIHGRVFAVPQGRAAN